MARPKKPVRLEVLAQASKDVQDREAKYGRPSANHNVAMHLMAAWLEMRDGEDLTAVDSCILQIMHNLARLAHEPNNAGVWENIAGYAAIGYEVANEQ